MATDHRTPFEHCPECGAFVQRVPVRVGLGDKIRAYRAIREWIGSTEFLQVALRAAPPPGGAGGGRDLGDGHGSTRSPTSRIVRACT